MKENSVCNTLFENLLVGQQLGPHFAFIFAKINVKSQFFRLSAYIYPFCNSLFSNLTISACPNSMPQ